MCFAAAESDGAILGRPNIVDDGRDEPTGAPERYQSNGSLRSTTPNHRPVTSPVRRHGISLALVRN